MQEETIAHGDQGQGHGCMAAKAKGKSGGKLNEQKREEMEGSTVAPNKNGGWDREFVYECDDHRVPSNLNSDQACSYSNQACDTDFFFCCLSPFFCRMTFDFFLGTRLLHCCPVPTDLKHRPMLSGG